MRTDIEAQRQKPAATGRFLALRPAAFHPPSTFAINRSSFAIHGAMLGRDKIASLHAAILGCAAASMPAPQCRRFISGDATARSASRSEEHTSELQSLMRISYAVFCLKKKQNNTHQQNSNNQKRKLYTTAQQL